MATQALLVEQTEINQGAIQGDVLLGLQKDAQLFIFFEIRDVPSFKTALKAAVPLITTTADVRANEAAIAQAKAKGTGERLQIFGFNLALTKTGVVALLGDQSAQVEAMDEAFVAGAASRTNLGDDPSAWLEDFREDGIHGVFLITGPGLPDGPIASHAAKILGVFGPSIGELLTIPGQVRRDRGHEHFGFEDGVSQPGIRGLTKPQNPNNDQQGLPGQDLLAPGEFVFGYPEQDPATMAQPLPAGPPPLAWMFDGSYMVFRRLEQKVMRFRTFVEAEGDRLGIDPDLLAARMVGRWPSGAPVSLAPLQDDPALGANPMQNNNFEFGTDPHQRRCPYGAHIRKTYPRDDLNDALGEAGEAGVQTRRLRRAGIPFGPELTDIEEKDGIDHEARGLLFVSYQTSIVDQFEFVQESWANNEGFVFGKTRPAGRNAASVSVGHDPIIGQAPGPRRMDEPVPNYPVGNAETTLEMPEPFVITTASSYLFAPSIDALRTGPLVD